MPTGISKIWNYFKPSFVERPNPESGSGLSAFKNEWEALSETDKESIRKGIEDGTETY